MLTPLANHPAQIRSNDHFPLPRLAARHRRVLSLAGYRFVCLTDNHHFPEIPIPVFFATTPLSVSEQSRVKEKKVCPSKFARTPGVAVAGNCSMSFSQTGDDFLFHSSTPPPSLLWIGNTTNSPTPNPLTSEPNSPPVLLPSHRIYPPRRIASIEQSKSRHESHYCLQSLIARR